MQHLDGVLRSAARLELVIIFPDMPACPRVRLIHWNLQEAATHLDVLNRSHHQVEYEEQFRSDLMKRWRESPPDCFVIDLSRLPSHGREIAVALRQSPRTRLIPIVFCCGAPEKVSAIRSLLPDAAYCALSSLPATVKASLKNRPGDPIKPAPMMERYKGRTAAQKLGIVESSTLALVDPPANALKVIGQLPPAVEILEDSTGDESTQPAAVTLCFFHQPHSLARGLAELRHRASATKLWILWRKGGSAARGDVTERLVRETALDLGLVDYKICSVDSTWTAMLFARKK